GRNLLDIFPEFANNVKDRVINSVNQIEQTHDVYFFALPHGKSIQYAPKLLNKNKKVIDLGADFRLDDEKSFADTYQLEHTAPEYLSSKIYGLTELHETYNGTNLIANPGCYPTAALLSTIPFAKNIGEKVETISTVSYSGLSGAGKKADTSLLFSENYNSVRAYSVGTHRHQVEIKQELDKYIDDTNYSLATHLLPVVSGIYSTSIIHLNGSVSQSEVDDILQNEYLQSTFIRIRETPPELKWVVGTNYCDINVKALDNKIIVTACIDNLIKGASGQAVQNMNKLYGWGENLGIQNNKMD
ncbi:MAG: N-acetyl-gamma-glutamyl-phosphate reductase, partial [Melioribacteraceae bacterium]